MKFILEKSRDICTLQKKLLNMGAADRIYIGSMLVLGQLARRGFLPPGVWFLKSAQKYILKFLKRLKKEVFQDNTSRR